MRGPARYMLTKSQRKNKKLKKKRTQTRKAPNGPAGPYVNRIQWPTQGAEMAGPSARGPQSGSAKSDPPNGRSQSINVPSGLPLVCSWPQAGSNLAADMKMHSHLPATPHTSVWTLCPLLKVGSEKLACIPPAGLEPGVGMEFWDGTDGKAWGAGAAFVGSASWSAMSSTTTASDKWSKARSQEGRQEHLSDAGNKLGDHRRAL